MARISSGLVLYRIDDGMLKVLLMHPGGPFSAKKDVGYWSIPKGEVDKEEDLLPCACREFWEETGHAAPAGVDMLPLGSIQQKGGKIVHAWAFPGEWFPERFSSNTFLMEWPPKSGKKVAFPEADKAELMPLGEALRRIKDTQRPLLLRLANHLNYPTPEPV